MHPKPNQESPAVELLSGRARAALVSTEAALPALRETLDVIEKQECRDCGDLFPFNADADRCPACVAAVLGEGRRP